MSSNISLSVLFVMIFCYVTADDKILKLYSSCPDTMSGTPIFTLITDVPAYAQASCKNGVKMFSPDSQSVVYRLLATFDPSYNGTDCQVNKKTGSNTFTLRVEYGWGETNSRVISRTEITMLSCAYDRHGKAKSQTETVRDSILAAKEVAHLVGPVNLNVSFNLQLMDVMDRVMSVTTIDIGKKIRLYATDKTGSVVGFQPVSCFARNGVNSYQILVAGCGDGLILPIGEGFSTSGSAVYSPYFRTFRLRGSNNLQFSCNFTICDHNCDGSSCTTASRKRRSVLQYDVHTEDNQPVVVKADSVVIVTTGKEEQDNDHVITDSTEVARLPWNFDERDHQDNSRPAHLAVVIVFMCVIVIAFTIYFYYSKPKSSFLI